MEFGKYTFHKLCGIQFSMEFVGNNILVEFGLTLVDNSLLALSPTTVDFFGIVLNSSEQWKESIMIIRRRKLICH